MCAIIQTGAASSPPETFSHSTTTVPLNARSGRRTRILVVNGAVSPGSAAHRPSAVRSPASRYDSAVPSSRNSCSA